ncbi:MAG TPA: potassium channel family protein [Solirubrobacterales bacterium]|nr:potassium channel family protein [Solirubrobacterales bacterium]
MTALSTAAGVLLVLVALRDVFDTLFHPHGRGVVSEAVVRQIWRAMRLVVRGNHAALSLAGPLAFLTVIVTWGTLVVIGFALMLWPHFPEGFANSEAAVGSGGHFGDAIYLSLVNLTSLGYGDIAPTSDYLRLLGPLETLIGLGLLTASISWILFLYRVLADYRSLSHEILLLSDAERKSDTTLASIEAPVAAQVLADLTSRVIAIRDDLVHSPIAYYFHPRSARHALPVLLPRLLEIVDECSGTGQRALRFEAALLQASLEDLLDTVASQFVRVPTDGTDRALAAYRQDHLWDPA